VNDIGHRDSILIDKAWSRVKAAAFFVTNIMKAKKKFGMELKQTEKKGRKKIMKNKIKKTNLLTVINVATKTFQKLKPLDILNHNRKIESVASPIERVMFSLLSPIVRGKDLRSKQNIFSLLPNRKLSNNDITHFAQKYITHIRGVFMRDLLPEESKSRECGIVNLANSRSSGTRWVAYNNKKGS